MEQQLDRPQGVFHLYRELWRYAAGARGILVGAFTLLIGSQLFKLAVPWLAGQAINEIQSGGLAGLPHAGLLLAGVFCATAASWAMHGPGRVLERNAAMRVREMVFAALTRRVLDAPLAWHEARHTAETVSRVNQATGALYGFAESQYIYLQNSVRLFGPVVALWLIAPAVGMVAVCGYIVLGFLISRFDRRIMEYSLRESQTERRLSAALVDSLGNITTVFALRRRDGVAELMLERMRATFAPLRRSMVVNEAKWCTVDLLSALLWCVLLLDEPTSSLDPETERKVLDRMLASHAGACVVSSVHRLNLLDRFDEVVLMQQGRVVDVGPPGDLALRSQVFRDLLSAQAATPA